MSIEHIHPEARTAVLAAMNAALFTKPAKRIYSDRVKLINENSMLHDNVYACMSYRNELFWYGNKPEAPKKKHGEKQPPPYPMNQTHRKMREKMREHTRKISAFKVEQEKALGYIGAVLLKTVHIDELYKLIPTSLHKALQRADHHFIPGTGPMTSEAIETFMLEHSGHLRMLKARLAHNLLDVSKP